MFSDTSNKFELFFDEKNKLQLCLLLSFTIDSIGTLLLQEKSFQISPIKLIITTTAPIPLIFLASLYLGMRKHSYFKHKTLFRAHYNLLLLTICGFLFASLKVLLHYLLFGDFNSAPLRIFRSVFFLLIISTIFFSTHLIVRQIKLAYSASTMQNRVLSHELEQLQSEIQDSENSIKQYVETKILPYLEYLKGALIHSDKTISHEYYQEIVKEVEFFSKKIIRHSSYELYDVSPETYKTKFSQEVTLKDKSRSLSELITIIQVPSLVVPILSLGMTFSYALPECLPRFSLIGLIILIELIIIKIMSALAPGIWKYFGFFSLVLTIFTSVTSVAYFQNVTNDVCGNFSSVNAQNLALILGILGLIASSLSPVIRGVLASEISQRSVDKIILKEQISQARAVLVANSQTVAKVLHGEVQGVLVGISMALQLSRHEATSSENDQKSEDLIKQLINRLVAVEHQIKELPKLHVDKVTHFQPAIAILEKQWAGILEVEVKASKQLLSTLGDNAFLNWIVVEAVREIATNSVTHGNSSKVVIEVSCSHLSDGTKLLQLIANNDGLPVLHVIPGSGLLSMQLQKIGGSIQIAPSSTGGVCTVVTIPVGL